MRKPLLYAVPTLVILIAITLYLNGGRYATTDNAYIKSDMVMISALVSSPLSKVHVEENQFVQPGDVLFSLDDEVFRIALERTNAQLEAARRTILSDRAAHLEKRQELVLAKSELEFAERQHNRQKKLATSKVVSESALDEARQNVLRASQRIAILENDLARSLADFGGDINSPIESHPDFVEAKARRDQAKLDLDRTVVKAPFAGIVGNVPQPGDFVRTGLPVMALVSSGDYRVEANFKETDLAFVREGQPVKVSIDTYPGLTLDGVVESISQATGAEYSILPPQNASGNWVKVVQRISVRIQFQESAEQPPLRAGMSCHVEIDTGRSRGLPGSRPHLLSSQPGTKKENS